MCKEKQLFFLYFARFLVTLLLTAKLLHLGYKKELILFVFHSIFSNFASYLEENNI